MTLSDLPGRFEHRILALHACLLLACSGSSAGTSSGPAVEDIADAQTLRPDASEEHSEPDSGLSPMDDASLNPGTDPATASPQLELLSPASDPEIYRGEGVSFAARCTPSVSATSVALSFTHSTPQGATHTAHGAAASLTFADLGAHSVQVNCTDDQSASASRTVTVHVVEQPHIVLTRSREVVAVRADQIDQPEVVFSGTGLRTTLVQEARYVQGADILLTVATPEGTESDRGVYAIYRNQPADTQVHRLVMGDGYDDGSPSLHVSPDERYLLTSRDFAAPVLHRLDPAGPVLLPLTLQGNPAYAQVHFSRDGRYLLYGAGGPLQLVDLESEAAPVVLDSNTGLPSWSNPMFSPDGSHLAFRRSTPAGNRVYSVATQAAAAGSAPVEVALDGASVTSLWHVSDRALFVHAEGPDQSRSLAVIGHDHALRARFESPSGQLLFERCGNRAMVGVGDGFATLVYDEPLGLRTLRFALPETTASLPAFSASCQTAFYTTTDDTYYFEVPSPDATVAPEIRRVSGSLLDVIATSAGDYVVTRDSGDTDPALLIHRPGAPPLSIRADGSWAISPDGAWLWQFRKAGPTNALPRERWLHQVPLLGPLAGEAHPVYGPSAAQSPIVFSADGRHLAVRFTPSVDAQGDEIVGFDGLVELDLGDPLHPLASPVLPQFGTEQGSPSARRVAGGRTLLIEEPGPTSTTKTFYVRSLWPGRTALEQPIPGPKLGSTRSVLVSPSGEILAVHQALREQELIATVGVRHDADAPLRTAQLEARPGQSIVAFGSHENSVIVREAGSTTAPARLTREDLSAHTSELVFEAEVGETIEIASAQAGSMHLWFVVMNPEQTTRTLYVHELGVASPRVLITNSRIYSVADAHNGEWLIASFVDDAAQTHYALWDARRGFEPLALAGPADRGRRIATFQNRQGDGALVSTVEGDAVWVWRLETGEVRPLSINHARELTVSADGRRAAFLGRVGASFGMWSIDLETEELPITRVGPLPFGTLNEVRMSAFSRDGSYAVLTRRDRYELLRLSDGASLSLPPVVRGLSFDRLGRYLMYHLYEGGHRFDVQVQPLHDFNESPRVIPTDDEPGIFWVDD